MSQDALSVVLKESGYSTTKPRQAVFSALQGHEPMSIQDLIKQVQPMDRASVYRTLNLFIQLGIVQRISIGWKYKYELAGRFSSHHHHLVCQMCHSVLSVDDDAGLESYIQRVAGAHGFRPVSHQFEIEGLCAKCK